MATEIDNTIYGGNGYEFEYPILKKNDPDGAKVPANGLAGITGHIAATEDGNPIHVTLSVALAERSAKPGTYFGRILGANIDAHLSPTYDNKDVHIVIKDATGEIRGDTKVKYKPVRKV